RPPGFTPFRIY
nr:RecName: Full=[Thr6]-phyllokinin [Physalaemus nattereri]P84901.1 RecName: Full=[Thr6]-phyllokinin [Pithecopus hypochondrialis]P86632.1 RecName: Full=[Thr6]-Phyllokinin [Phasmahyla jandaia]